jgi:hypothetical protein
MLASVIAGKSPVTGKERTMAHARQADRAFPQAAIYLFAALAAATLVMVIVLAGALGPLGVRTPTTDGIQVDPAVIEAGQQWELQRKAQSGYVDPVIQAGRDWEKQRKQQSGASE